MNWCGSSCLASYIQSMTDNDLLSAFVVLLIIVPMLLSICHEAGHYYAAKLCGIDCEEFALGKGPALLRFPGSPSGCMLALRVLPVGGRVTYDYRYWQVSYTRRAFISAAGWLADVLVAIIIIAAAYLVGATGPIASVVCGQAGFRVAYNLLPITSDGRKTLRYLWLAVAECLNTAKSG